MAETKSSPAAESLQLTSNVTPYDPEKASQLCFKGIPYSSIIKEYWSLNGGEPQEGERNVKLHQLAVNLRAICDNNVELILQIIPRYSLPEDETRRIVASACKEEPKGISTKMKSIIKKLQSKPASEPDYNAEDPAPVATPLKYLPIGLKETVAGLPANMHMPVLCAIMPLAATYADGVKVEYLDGNMQRLGLMAIIRGEQASNKTVCKNAIEIWKKPLEREDAEARKLEDKWREKKRNRKANEKIPDDPKVCILTPFAKQTEQVPGAQSTTSIASASTTENGDRTTTPTRPKAAWQMWPTIGLCSEQTVQFENSSKTTT